MEITNKPYFVNFQITRKCNLNCLHCGFNAGKGRFNELSFQEIIDTISDLYYLGTKKIQITGGEPLLRKDVFEIIEFGNSLGINMQMLSNGYYITNETVEKLNKSGISGVGISIDGLQKSHNIFRQDQKAFNKATKAIRILKKNDISVNVLTTVNKLSLQELDKLLKLMIDLKVNNWIIQTTAKVGRMADNDSYALDPIDMLEIENFVAKNINNNRINILVGDSVGYYSDLEIEIRKGLKFTGCHAGIYQMGILSNGSIVGCLAMPHTSQFIEGNIREKPIRKIWFDKNSFSYTRKFSASLLSGNCKSCKFGVVCKAGCKANAFGATNNLFDNPYCSYSIKQKYNKDEKTSSKNIVNKANN